MKLTIIKLGRPAFASYDELVKVYEKRLSTFISVEGLIIRAADDKETQRKLTKSLASRNSLADGVLVVLDESGKSFDSPDLARQIGAWRDDSRIKTVTFLIGGPYGVDSSVKKRANLLISLSPLVFTSDMAWLIVWEQIYRAFTILHNQSYHHE